MPAQPTRPTHPCGPKPQPHVSVRTSSTISRTPLHSEDPCSYSHEHEHGSSEWRDVREIVEDVLTETWFCRLDPHRGSSGWVALAPLLESLRACTRAIYRKKIPRTKQRAQNFLDIGNKLQESIEKHFIHVPKDVKNIFYFQKIVKKAFVFSKKIKN